MLRQISIRDTAITFAAVGSGLWAGFVIATRHPILWIPTDFAQIPVAALAVFVAAMLFFLPALAGKIVLPEKWGLAALITTPWWISSLFVAQSYDEGYAAVAIVATATFSSFLSFFIPAGGRDLLLWLPTVLYLSVVFVRTILAGPLPGGFFGQLTGSIAFGHLMVVGFVATYFLSQRLPAFRNLIFAAGTVFVVGVMLSGSRGALVGLVVAVGIIVVGVFLRSGMASATREVTRFGLLGGVAVLPFFLPYEFVTGREAPGVLRRKIMETFELSEQVGSVEVPYSAGRFQIWSTTLEQFETFADVVIGKGQSTIQLGSGATYPHNLFLELLLIGGLVTVVPFILFLVFLFWKMFDRAYQGRFEFFVLAATTGLFSMFSGDLSYNIIFFYFLGLAYGQVLKHTGRTINLRQPRCRI